MSKINRISFSSVRPCFEEDKATNGKECHFDKDEITTDVKRCCFKKDKTSNERAERCYKKDETTNGAERCYKKDEMTNGAERCFEKDENFLEVICETFDTKNVELSQIDTGWTNIVFKVLAEGKSFIFRFPRNNFWAKVLENECEFNRFLTSNTDIPTARLQLLYHKSRPFSYHKMIVGQTLGKVYCQLNQFDKQKIAIQIAEFLLQLQAIDCKKVPVRLQNTSQFLEELSRLQNDYDLSRHKPLVQLEKTAPTVLAHGDLNADNILVDDACNVCAILDFAFVSKSNSLTDLARIIGRLPKDFLQPMLNAYRQLFGRKTDQKIVQKIVDVYAYVDQKYIQYIKKFYPEIALD